MIVQRKLNLDKEHIEWFEQTFPETSISGIFNLFLEKLKQNMGNEGTPMYHIDQVAKQIIDGE